jgi:methyl-accepting chemotaxis protein
MKINQPVTDNEVHIKEGQVIVTKTDMKGIITYANRDFIEISGFGEHELIGKNHNMVRHPDMPPAAFEDLWSTVKKGNPWVAIVKNRCKNGDYYWVEAHVTPVYKNGQVVEYMSVRKKPEQQKILAAQKLYSDINAGSAQFKPTGLKKWLNYARNEMRLSFRLAAGIAFIVSMLIMVSLYSSQQMKHLAELTDNLYQHSFSASTSLLKINNDILRIERTMKDIALASNEEDIVKLSWKVSAYEEKVNEEFKKAESFIEGDTTKLQEARQLFVDWKPVRDEVIALMSIDDRESANDITNSTLSEHVKKMQAATQYLIDTSFSKADKFIRDAGSIKENVLTTTYSMIAITLLISIFIAFIIIRGTVKPLRNMVQLFRTLQGDPQTVDIDLSRKDEIGDVLQALKSVQIKLGYDITEAEEVADSATRIKQALDNVSSNVMVLDNNRDIIYMNAAVKKMLTNAEKDLKQAISGFDCSSLLGSSFDQFHPDKEQQRELIDALSDTATTDITIGNRKLRMIANPVKDTNDSRLGTVVEWVDRTQEVGIEEEIQGIVTAALAGNLTQRISLHNKFGFLERLSQGVNELVDVSECVINDTIQVMGAMSHGDLTKTITSNYEGSFGQLKANVNQTITKLTDVLSEISDNANSVMNGANEIAQGNADLSQRTEEQASSLEETASSMEEMTSTVRQNADNAREANQLAASARTQAEKGGDVVGSAVNAMSEITTSSRKIADIISVIDEIAFQTNLLALNAAVEAARAGEQGRGFAVVASEVRNLAGRSATAAKEIKALIEDSVQKVDEGSKLVDESGKTLEEIMTSVKKVSDIIAEIAAAGEEQSIGIEQVNKAVSQMDEMTQQNAALVEQAAAASESMGEQARSLSGQVNFFTTGSRSSHSASQAIIDRRSSDRPWSDASSDGHSHTAINRLDFSAARTKHLSWKTKLRNFIDGKESMTEDQAVSHHDCDLGKWLYSTGLSQYGHYPEMKQLESIHADLHNTIKDVVRYKKAGDDNTAENKLANIEFMSGKIINLLNDVEAKVKASNSGSSNTDTVHPAPDSPVTKQVAGSDVNSSSATTDDSQWEEF